MNHFIYGIKREYWEHKRLLVMLPLIATGLFCLMAIVGTWMHHHPESSITRTEQSAEEAVKPEITAAEGESERLENGAKQHVGEGDGEQEDPFWFAGAYLAFAWLGALFYALSSLYSDRKDKSILYWKTMPVSELRTVLIKYLFAMLAFSVVALVIAWVTAAVLISYAQMALPAEMQAGDEAGMSAPKLIVWPVLAILVGSLWCAPFFAYALYVSSAAKKMPIMLFMLPLLGLYAVERIVLSSTPLFGFFSSHSPFSMLASFSEMQTAGEFLRFYLVDNFASLLVGLIISGGFLWAAAHRRDTEFEM